MIYAQIKSGRKLHLAMQAGEEFKGEVIRAGQISKPICGQPADSYRMTINMPLGHACKKCRAMAARSR